MCNNDIEKLYKIRDEFALSIPDPSGYVLEKFDIMIEEQILKCMQRAEKPMIGIRIDNRKRR